MRKIMIVFLILALFLSGCGSVTQNVPASESQQQSDFSTSIQGASPTESNTEADLLQYSFRGYSITIPDTWVGQYACEQSDDSIAFYEKQDYVRNGSGFLFSLSLYLQSGDYDYLPSYQLVGDIGKNGANHFEKLVAVFPTDVQFDTDTMLLYQEMQNDIDAILSSVVAASGYTFYAEGTATNLDLEIQTTENAALEIQNELQATSTQSDMNAISAKEYQLWDDELNSLWRRFYEEASDDLRSSVIDEQTVWIKNKETKVDFAGAPFEGGTMQPLVKNTKAAALTRTRCYELAGYLASATGQSFTLEVPKLESYVFVNRQGTPDIYSELSMEETDSLDYIVSIGIYRLTTFEGTAVMRSACTYEFEDESLGVKGIIHLLDDGSHATFEVTDSSCKLTNAGDVFEFPESLS